MTSFIRVAVVMMSLHSNRKSKTLWHKPHEFEALPQKKKKRKKEKEGNKVIINKGFRMVVSSSD